MSIIKYNSNGFKKKFGNTLIFLTFFIIFVFPGALQLYKAPFFILSLVLIIFNIALKKSTGFSPVVLILCLLFLIRGLWGTTIGIIKNTPGVFNLMPIYIYWVILYIFFLTQINSKKAIKTLINCIIISAYIIALADIFFVLQFLNFIPESINPFSFYYAIYEPYDYAFAFGYSAGRTIEFLAYNINSLFFSFPFTLALLFNDKSEYNTFWTKKIIIIGLILLNTLVVIMSNRRMLMIIMAFSPAVILLFSFYLKKKNRRKIYKYVFTFASIAAVGLIYFFINLASEIDIDTDSLLNDFTHLTDKSRNPRYVQSEKLLDYWAEAPLEGQGSGASVPGYTRNDTSIWAYELSYHLHLLQFGIVGFILELVFYFGILLYGIKIIKKRNDIIMIALLSGYICFLIANATNPYCNSFDFLWPLFLPLAYINMAMLDKTSKSISI